MGVLYLVEFLKQGGVERILHQLALQMSQSGRPCYLFSYETEKLTEVGKQIQKSGIEVFTYKKKPGYDLKLLWQLAKVIREKNIRVIHTQDFGPTEYAIALKILFPKLRLVHTQHTLHYMIQYRKYLLFLQFASFFYSTFSCVSEPMKTSLEEECPLLRGRIQVIPNGVDTEKFSPAESSPKKGLLRLVTVSRISPEKNLIFLLEACLELKKRKVAFHLDHIGSGIKSEESKIRNFIKKNKLHNEVTLHGFQEDVRPFLKEADVFVSTSITEGHPVAVLEAMSSGLPCLLSDIPAHRVFHSAGLQFFPLELSALVSQLEKTNAPFLKKGKNNRKTILEEFSIAHMLKTYQGLYGTLG